MKKTDKYADMSLKDIEAAMEWCREYARSKYPQFTTWYEVYGALKEELDEFWESIRERDPNPDELIGMAAVSQLAILEMCKKKKEEGK